MEISLLGSDCKPQMPSSAEEHGCMIGTKLGDILDGLETTCFAHRNRMTVYFVTENLTYTKKFTSTSETC